MKRCTLILLGLVFCIALSSHGWAAGQEKNPSPGQSAPVMKCEARFHALDANQDGMLSYQEFIADRSPTSQTEEMFRSRDINGDNALTMEEFCSKKGMGRIQAPKQ
jgi:Ca2+-binding EF-hand superfamily protein